MDRGLFVHASDRLEELAEALATVLRRDRLPPLVDEVVLVPTQGLARWLKLQLATHAGIAGGLRLPFPGAFLQQLAGADTGAAAGAFAPEVLQFRIWRLLADPALAAALGPARRYVADDPDDRKHYQLASRLAAAFDDYQLYRPELLPQWAAGGPAGPGEHAAWQARLWRELLHDAGLADPARDAARRRSAGDAPTLFPFDPPSRPPADHVHRITSLQRRLADPAAAAALLPPRLSVFGASTLPPAFVPLLAAAAAHVPVHLFVPEPGVLRANERAGGPGNPLFLRLGAEARDFAAELADAAADHRGRVHRFVLPRLARRDLAAPTTLLARLQHDLAHDLDGSADRLQLRAADDSVRVHDCHSPQRELEVVRDQILAAFAGDRTLQPHDVVVLVPDVERYAPFAHAVFGPVREHLPFHVADKSPASDLPLCASTIAMLELARDRLAAHDVLHLLDEPAVQRRFRILPGDLPYLRQRCDAAGIRWGLDGAWRERSCRLPAFDDNAWLPGLERLLLGAATGPVDDLVLGRLPVADATAGREDLLLRFLGFARTLFQHLDGLVRPQPVANWADRVDALVAAMHAPAGADDDAAVAALRTATTRLREAAAAAAFVQPVHPVALQDWLLDSLRRTPGPRGFLAGAVTVAALLPMRAVPARCVFVCGLDDQSFPRRDRPLPFDLIAADPRRGDRSARADDRQLFLDVLLAARDRLHLCLVGRSQKDDSPCAPSAVVVELLDQIDRCCHAPPGCATPRDAVVVRHPLQPWSERYRTGDDARLFTFTRADLEVRGEPGPEPAWAAGPPPSAEGSLPAELTLDDLLSFWWHPCRWFLQHVVRLRVRSDDDVDEPYEPFAVDPLRRWQLQSGTVQRALRGDPPPADAVAHMRATGLLPVGGLGAAAFADVDDETQCFLTTLRAAGPLQRRPLAVAVDGVTVRGELAGVAADALVYARIARLKPKDHLRAWIQHVLASVARTGGDADWPDTTRIVAKDQVLVLQPLPAEVARAQLTLLLQGRRDGAREPLPFAENASREYGHRLHRDGDDDAALRAARNAWEPAQPGDPWRGDAEDQDLHLCWRGRDLMATPGFAALAKALWRTIHGYSRKVS